MSDTCPFPCLATPGLPACYPLTFMVSPDVSLGGGFSFAAVEILGPSFAPSTAFPLCQGLCAQRVSRRDISGWLCSFTTRQGQGAPATPPSPPKMSKHRSSRRGTRRFPGFELQVVLRWWQGVMLTLESIWSLSSLLFYFLAFKTKGVPFFFFFFWWIKKNFFFRVYLNKNQCESGNTKQGVVGIP